MRNFRPAHFDKQALYVPKVIQPQLYEFKVIFSGKLRQRGDTGIIADRISVTLNQLGVQMQELRISKFDATVTIVVPLDVTISSVIETVTSRVASAMRALV